MFNQGPTGEEYKVWAEQLLDNARVEYQKIRGESVREVVLEVVNQSWVIENWGVGYIDTKQTIIEENTYKALFMIPQDADLYEIKLSWTGMYHAAKWKGNIYVVEDNFDITQNSSVTATFVHELTHIMQDNYSLPQSTTIDANKALSALKEGDATLMADTYKNNGVVPPSAEVTMPRSSSIPKTIDRLNRFVYRYGVEFVKAIYQQGGWEAVNQAYSILPNTTEQIMHPEKYFSQENAQTVRAPTVTGNWSLTKTDSFGEYFVYVMLDHWISTEDAKTAAEGWGGDLFSYYENGDEFIFTWNIVWDSENDANEFYEKFQDMMAETLVTNIDKDCWFEYGRYLRIHLNENSTLITSSVDASIVQ
ncbi:MAG: hypothetical protein IAX21_08660 [Candidatus Bathyarchaeota archaeon]|nr:MAG: hypothetical protein NUK63_09060 [Candidatus Bathyarchaeum tardum]WNZ28713.1 MAG: hypothetical protein IAX21_08660 [Candidatus Bathyarchaeota archaeon]